MTPFAFVIHPIDARRDVARKYPLTKFLPMGAIEFFLKRKKPLVLSKITGIKSAAGATTEGWFVGCPLTPKMMLELPLDFVYEKIVECCRLGAEQGAKVIGLGAFTAVVGDGGITIAKHSPIPVTTGNSYTVATAIEGAVEAARLVDIETSAATLAVVGATGSIGRTCALLLAPMFERTLLIGRDEAKAAKIAEEVGHRARATSNIRAISDADVIVSVTSSDSSIIMPEHLKPGCVVCDVARPRDVSTRVAKERLDVLVIEGGIVEVPGDVNFGFDFGFPPRTAYACMSETMMLALEDRPESFTLGKTVSVEQVKETIRLAQKHGFRLAGFRSFEKPVSQEAIERVKQAVRRRATAVPGQSRGAAQLG